MTHLPPMKPVVFFLLFAAALSGQNPGKGPLSIGVHYLSAKDYSTQMPDGAATITLLMPSAFRAWEIQASIPIQPFFQLETGYRFKKHTQAFKTDLASANTWVETTHSIPVRAALLLHLKHAGILSRFYARLSGGILFDIMQQSEGFPLLTDFQFQLPEPAGYLLTETYDPAEVNQIKTAFSLNGQVQLSCKILSFFSIDAGIGYTKGSKILATEHYAILDPNKAVVASGSTHTKGTYRYWMLGGRYYFGG